MIHLRNRTGLIAGALAAASIALAATTSFAVPRYDGLWSVAIVTHQGDCIASYRYPMRIANGILANGGDPPSMSAAGWRPTVRLPSW